MPGKQWFTPCFSSIEIERARYREQIGGSLEQFRVTALLGPRQCGKTTLARQFVTIPAPDFDLEDPLDLARVDAPRQVLGRLTGLVVIDEIQRRPHLFPLLRVRADRPASPARFLILGSASPDLVKGVSESLAGRVGFLDLNGFDLAELGAGQTDALWRAAGSRTPSCAVPTTPASTGAGSSSAPS